MDDTPRELASAANPSAPFARPITLSYADQPDPGGDVFPLLSIGRAAAVKDLIALMGFILLFAAMTLYSGLPLLLETYWSKGGHFIWVPIHGLLCLTLIALIARHRRQGPSAIGLGKTALLRVFLGTLAAVPLCFLAGAISNMAFTVASGGDFASFARERGQFFDVVADLPIGWVVPLSVFVGIYEEIVFRGFMLSRLRALAGSNVGPVIISALIFGALHFSQGLVGMCQTAAVGLVLGTVAVRTRSIWPCILAHTTIDTISLLFAVIFNDDLQRTLHVLTSQAAS